MLALRNEKSKQIAREAIDEGAGLQPDQWGTGEGWRRLIVHTTQAYLKSTNIRGMGEVLSKLGTAAGYLTRDDGEKVSPGAGITGTPAAIRELLVILDEEIQSRLEKAQAIDAEEK
jgi:hypothetical protein